MENMFLMFLFPPARETTGPACESASRINFKISRRVVRKGEEISLLSSPKFRNFF